jgi:hypothetical protein
MAEFLNCNRGPAQGATLLSLSLHSQIRLTESVCESNVWASAKGRNQSAERAVPTLIQKPKERTFFQPDSGGLQA